MLKEKDKAPLGISVTDAAGNNVSLKDYIGKIVVLYFYPKDDTPGCTIEAKEFEDYLPKLKKLDAIVIGVSKDNEKSHQKFADKFSLTFPLWSDPEHTLMDAFGVWQLKKFMGREYMGAVRATFVINERGVVVKVFPQVTPKDHGKEVFNFVKDLSK